MTKQFEVGDLVRVDGTVNTATVVKADDSYAQVQFEDGSKVWFTQKTAKESGAGKYRTIQKTNEAEIEKVAKEIAQMEALKQEKKARKAHNERVREQRNAEWFRRFCKFEGVENFQLISFTQVGKMEVIVFSAKSQDAWHRNRDEETVNVFTVVLTQGKEYDSEASWEAYQAAKESGTEATEVYFDGWAVQVSWMNEKQSGTRGNSQSIFRTKEEALFSALASDLVKEPSLGELGLKYAQE